jgi:hypothetical protein
VLRQLSDAGLAVRGEVGDEDPAQAVADVLHAYAADQIVLVHHSEGFERYKEHDLLRRIRAHYAGPVDSLQLNRAGRVVAHS